jgi:hypothetical protein
LTEAPAAVDAKQLKELQVASTYKPKTWKNRHSTTWPQTEVSSLTLLPRTPRPLVL